MNKLPLLLAGMMVFSFFAPTVLPATEEPVRTISVTGDATVKVVPDEVIITLGVETRDSNLDDAKEENDKRVRRIIALAKSHGVEAKHIKTDFINIYPEYEYHSDAVDQIVGYRVGKTVVITLRDIGTFDALFSDVVELGANYVHGVDFRTTELRKYRDRARALAINAAEEKAVALTAELGRSIGDPISINENHTGWWSSYGSWWGYRWGSMMSQNVVQNAGLQGYTTEGGVAPGQIEVNASVSVTFELQ